MQKLEITVHVLLFFLQLLLHQDVLIDYNNETDSQGVDLAYLKTGISGVGYFWTTQENTLPLKENLQKIRSKN